MKDDFGIARGLEDRALLLELAAQFAGVVEGIAAEELGQPLDDYSFSRFAFA